MRIDSPIMTNAVATGSFTGSFSGDGSNLTGIVHYTDSDTLAYINTLNVLSGSDGYTTDVELNASSSALITGYTNADNSLSSSLAADIAINTAKIGYTDALVKTKLNAENVVSASSFSSPSQGTVRATINGVNTDVDTGLQAGDSPTFANLVVTGNLTVEGTRTELQVTELNVEDKNILIASGAADSAAADGAGITIGGANESITWNHANSRFNISDDLNIEGNITLTGTVDGVDIAALDTTVSNLNDTYATDAELNASSSALTTAYTNADNSLSSSIATALTSEYVAADSSLSSSLAADIAVNTAKIGVTTETVRTAGALMDDEVDADIKTLSLPASTTISAFGKTLVDDADAATARTTLGVDAAGTDNSTDVTLAGSLDYITISGQQITRNAIDVDTDLNITPTAIGKAVFTGSNAAAIRSTIGVDAAGTDNSTDVTLTGAYDYITISGQTITRNQITNDDLAGSIANAKLANSSITINGSAVSLGGTRTLVTDDIAEDGSPVNLWYTDTRVKTKLNSDNVVSGSATQVRTFLNVENGADVTDTANVTAAGALMDSEVDADLKTFSLPANTTISTFGASLVDDTTAAAARTTLGVDEAGTDNSTDVTLDGSYDYITIVGQTITRNQITNDDLAGSIANAKLANSTITINGNSTALGGSYSVTAADVGLGNVTNESKATMFTNAALTGNPTAPTQLGTDDSTKIATTAFVQGRIDAVIGTAGSTLDTLGELSASLSDDQDALTALTTTVGTKLAKASNLSDLTNAATARTNLGVAIGSDVQAYNSTLAAVAGGTYTGDDSITTVGTISTGTWQGSAISTTYIQNTSGTNTGDEPDASTTVKGIVELATTAETTTGTDATRAVTPDGLKDGYQGSTNVTTLGTIGTGTWQGTAIADGYISSAATWNAKLDSAGTIATNDYAKYDANGDLTGRSYAEVRSDLGLVIGTNVQAYDADLTTLGGLAKTDGNFIVGNGSTWVVESGATARTSLGLGSLATLSSINNGNWSGTDLAVANGGTGASDAATARTNLGLAIGTNVQAYDADLTTLGGLAKTDGNFIVGNGSTWVVESGATARTSLGLGSAATSAATDFVAVTGDTMTGNLTFSDTGEGIVWSMNTDGASIKFYNTGDSDTDSRLEFNTLDNNNEYFRWTHSPSGGSLFESMRLTPNTSGNSVLQVSGVVRATGDIVAYYSSDRELKDNITPIENALEKVEALGGYEFDWNDKQDVYSGHDLGVIAQEVEAVLPELVQTRDNGYKAVKYEKLTAVLIQAVKELSARVKELESK